MINSNTFLKKITIYSNIYYRNRKPAYWYRVEMTRTEKAADKGIQRDSSMVYVFSQQPVFPPSVWQNIGNYVSL